MRKRVSVGVPLRRRERGVAPKCGGHAVLLAQVGDGCLELDQCAAAQPHRFSDLPPMRLELGSQPEQVFGCVCHCLFTPNSAILVSRARRTAAGRVQRGLGTGARAVGSR
ncbi:MAG: hypothetical protein COZ57_27940, partial [Armatimonadetes bacterium CG_4_8_14_3_um_filter_66_20]